MNYRRIFKMERPEYSKNLNYENYKILSIIIKVKILGQNG
jgi:hypothetical protein